MDFGNLSNGGIPRLVARWPPCGAKTVHVTFAQSNWETPGVKLERQPDGEFVCFLGEQKPFEEIFFKFIIDGTKWEVNRSIPVVFDRCGHENNRWTLKEATEYHDSYVRFLRRRLTLANVNRAELCELALSIHGKTDKDGRQLECVIDEDGSGLCSRVSFKLSMSGSLSEIVFLRFQHLGHLGPGKQGKPTDNRQEITTDDMKEKENDTWVAKFPADLDHKIPSYLMPGINKSITEKERLMESECATLRFLNDYTKVPVPQVYAYDVRYKQALDLESEPEVGLSDLYTNGHETITENKIGWPFILMGNFGSIPSIPYELPMGNLWKEEQLSDESNHLKQMMLQQMIMYRMELAEHPLAACGYLTLDKTYWQTKNRPKSRKIRTPKSAFGIRPCIYDVCEPFTNSIVAAFENHPGQWIFPPARASNSLSSVTARFQHLLTHGTIGEKNHFVAVWQLRALLYELFGPRYENGPFVLQYPDLLPDNIFISGGLIDWERATVVPVQVAACPPRVCLGQLYCNDPSNPERTCGSFQSRPAEVFAKYRVECYANIEFGVSRMINEEHGITIREDSGSEGKGLFLSQVLRGKLLFPMCLLDELCNGFIDRSLVGKAAVRYFPLIYKMVKGHSWDFVKDAVMNKGVMRFVLQDWEKEQKTKSARPVGCGQRINTVECNNGPVP